MLTNILKALTAKIQSEPVTSADAYTDEQLVIFLDELACALPNGMGDIVAALSVQAENNAKFLRGHADAAEDHGGLLPEGAKVNEDQLKAIRESASRWESIAASLQDVTGEIARAE